MEVKFKLKSPVTMLDLVVNLVSQGDVEYLNFWINKGPALWIDPDLAGKIQVRAGLGIRCWERNYNCSNVSFELISDEEFEMTSFGGQKYTVTGSNVIYRGAFRGFLNQTFFPDLQIEGRVLDSICRTSLVDEDLTLRDYCLNVRPHLIEAYEKMNSGRANYPYPWSLFHELRSEGLI